MIRHDRSVRRLCAAVVAVGGLACLVLAYRLVADGDELARWPSAAGVVDEMTYRPAAVGGPQERRPMFTVSVRYRYAVGGQEYTAYQYSRTGGAVNLATAETIRERFPPGAACAVYYDPADPGQAYLDVRTGPVGWVVIWSLTAVGVLQLGLAGWGVWSRRFAERPDR